MKEIGVIVRLGKVVPGYERDALDLNDEFLKIIEKKKADGTFTSFEPFYYLTGDVEHANAFFIFKGPEEKVTDYFESEEMLRMKTRTARIFSHLTFDFLLVGEEYIKQIGRFADSLKVPMTV